MLSKNQINRACKHAMNNILSEGLTDVPLMNKAFESDFYRKDCDVRKEVIDIVTERIMSNNFDELKLNPLNHILIPKKKYADYRDCALVDILDETIYLTLVLSQIQINPFVEGYGVAVATGLPVAGHARLHQQSLTLVVVVGCHLVRQCGARAHDAHPFCQDEKTRLPAEMLRLDS